MGTQTNGGVQTIQAGDIKISTPAVAAAPHNQGATGVIVYSVKMKVSTNPVIVSNLQFTLSGTHDANDLTYVYVYYNATATSLSGATYFGSATATYAAPHAYSINVYKPMALNDSGYYIISANISATASDNKTIRLTGNTTPVVFGFTTAPNVTGTQTNGGLQTIQAGDIKISTPAVAAATHNQGATGVIVYSVKMKVSTNPVIVSNLQFTLSGTHDANDLTYVYVYYNATAASLSGATYLGSATATYAAPHAYSINVYKPMALNDSGYYIISANLSATASDNKTIRLTGNTTPVVFGFTTAPNVTGTQTNGGLQTIQAADITLTSNSVASGNMPRNSANNILYIARMAVATQPVVVNKVDFTLTGTHDADDLTYVYVYFNASTPSLTGATYLGSAYALYAAPHTYSINIYNPVAVGNNGYYIITATTSSTASTGKTVHINGAINPLVFGYTTLPNTTNNQTNSAGVKTITASAPPAFSSGEKYTGENNSTLSSKISLAPNPVVNATILSLDADRKAEAVIFVLSQSGKIVFTKKIIIEAGLNKISLGLGALMPGIYQLSINTKDGFKKSVSFTKE